MPPTKSPRTVGRMLLKVGSIVLALGVALILATYVLFEGRAMPLFVGLSLFLIGVTMLIVGVVVWAVAPRSEGPAG